MKKTGKTVYEMTDPEKKAVEEIKVLLKRIPKEEKFDPALEIKLGLLLVLGQFCQGNRKFTAFLMEMRDILLSD